MSVTPAVTVAVAGGFLPGLGKGHGGGCGGGVPWALVSRAAQVKVFLHLVVEKAALGALFTSSETMQIVSKTGRGL